MKRLIPLGLVAIIILTVLAISPVTPANAQSAGLISAVLSKMEKNRQDMKSLRSGISMEKYNSQLHDTDTYKGSVAYQPLAGRNANVRIEWNSPQHEIMVASNGAYTLCRPRLKTCYTGKTAAQRERPANSLLQFLSMSGAQLRQRFDIQDAKTETVWPNIDATHLTLVPHGSGASFKYAEVWIDNSSGMPVQTKVVEKNDDATTIRLDNIQKNASIGDGEFKLALEKGITVIPT